MVNPLVWHHPKGEKDHEKHIGASEHRFAPRGLAVNGATLADHDHEIRHK